jgi:hypothetical protein
LRRNAWLPWAVLGLLACSDPDEPARERAATRAPASAAAAPSTIREGSATTPAPTAASEGASEGERRVRGVFYTLTLPEGASDGVPSEPDVVDSVYVLSAEEGVTLSLFRPFPQQTDLDTWTRTVETILEGIPQRYDEAQVAGLPARVAELPGELRWTLIVDGTGHLYRCTAADGQDAAWLHERCDETVQSLSLVRAIQ